MKTYNHVLIIHEHARSQLFEVFKNEELSRLMFSAKNECINTFTNNEQFDIHDFGNDLDIHSRIEQMQKAFKIIKTWKSGMKMHSKESIKY